jgi:hypothetical protein
MALVQLEYWYDFQQERFLQQMVRAFSGFQYMTGRRTVNGMVIEPQLKVVPCTMASMDRQVSSILRNNSENTALSAPRITVSHIGLTGRRADVQHPGHVDTRQVVERDIDPETGEYVVGNENRGTSYTVQRMMPRPFEMSINVDIWTSNQSQKYQILEQILTIIYPDFQIQNSDNALDWTALTMMELTDIQWSSRSIPLGTETEIDVTTLSFRVPIWLSPPAKVKQQRIIEQIITNVYDGRDPDDIKDENFMFREITTPGEYTLSVEEGILRLLGPKGQDQDEDGGAYAWKPLLALYGKFRPTVSTIRLKMSASQLDEDLKHDIVGTLQYDSTNPAILHWQLDATTLPGNTLDPILGIIDPHRTYPGEGLPGQSNGQRYLVVSDIGPSAAWGSLEATANDIIQYNGGSWSVAHTPTRVAPGTVVTETSYVLNQKSGNQLRWDGQDWVKTIDGHYPPGYWRLDI